MSSSKELTCKGTLRKVIICLMPRTPVPAPLYVYHCLGIVYLFAQRRGGGELNQREGERGNREEYRSQIWVENINMTECTQEIDWLSPFYKL
jgi:hypothetical protein